MIKVHKTEERVKQIKINCLINNIFNLKDKKKPLMANI